MEPALNTDRLALMQDRLLEAALERRGLSFQGDACFSKFRVWAGDHACGIVYERDGRWFAAPNEFTVAPQINGSRSRIHAAAQLQSVRDLMDIETELALREVLRG